MIVQPVVEPMDRFAALVDMLLRSCVYDQMFLLLISDDHRAVSLENNISVV